MRLVSSSKHVMATIEQLVNRIETRLQMASGLSVQIHAEETIISMIQTRYTMIFDDNWWDSYCDTITLTLDGTTGKPTTNISENIRKFEDIHSIYHDSDDRPLPRRSVATNPNKQRRKAFDPSHEPASVFKVVPETTTGNVYLWYRTRVADTVWSLDQYTTEIPMDEELLVAAVALDFLIDEDSNNTAVRNLQQTLSDRMRQQRMAQFIGGVSKTDQSTNTQNDWWSD